MVGKILRGIMFPPGCRLPPMRTLLQTTCTAHFVTIRQKATGRGFTFVMYWLFLRHMGMLRTFGRVGRDVLHGSSALCLLTKPVLVHCKKKNVNMVYTNPQALFQRNIGTHRSSRHNVMISNSWFFYDEKNVTEKRLLNVHYVFIGFR